MSARRALIGGVCVLVAALVGGCAQYDYLQRTDRIGFHAGNAVKANLARQTIDPSNGSMYDTTGLGKNGSVIPPDPTGPTGAPLPPPTNPP